MPKLPDITSALNLPPTLAIDYFKKKVNIPTLKWDDLWNEQHTKGFMIAGAMKADLLQDFRDAVNAGIENGESLDLFRKRFDGIVEKYGWNYYGSRNWRSQIIFDTNVRTAYAAGRWQQMTDPEVLVNRPYLQYRHGDSVKPRPIHLLWDKLVLPADSPWWDDHYPPGGYGCKCKVYSLSKRDLQRKGKTGPDHAPDLGTYEVIDRRTGDPVQIPRGIDPGFAYNPGKDPGKASKVMGNILDRLDPDIKKKLIGEIAGKIGSAAKTSKKIVKDIAEELTPEPITDWTFIKDSQKGSNLGGLYMAPDGSKHYVKFYNDINQARIEILAQKINGEMGLAAPDLQIIELTAPDGQIRQGLASKWIEDLKALTAGEMSNHPDIAKAYQAAVLTKNWDIVGLGYDNLMQTADGRLICIDAGGSFTFRAQGSPKPFGADIGEIWSLRDKTLNPQAAKVFNAAFENNVFAEKDGMVGITKRKIGQALKDSGLGPDIEKEIKAGLEGRFAALVDRYNLDGTYTYEGFGKYLEDFKKWGGTAFTDRVKTPAGSWHSESYKLESDLLTALFEDYVDKKIVPGGSKTLKKIFMGWSGSSSSDAGAVLKKWAIDFKGVDPGKDLYHSGTGDALRRITDADKSFRQAGEKFGLTKENFDELLKAEFEYHQYCLTRLNGYDPITVERGMNRDEAQNYAIKKAGSWNFTGNAAFSTSNGRTGGFLSEPVRINFQIRNEDVIKTWYQGSKYLSYYDREMEFVVIGNRPKLSTKLSRSSTGRGGWENLE